MVIEFCPKCHALTNMMLTITKRREKNHEGKVFTVITKSYHCNICNTFVRSENKKICLNKEEEKEEANN